MIFMSSIYYSCERFLNTRWTGDSYLNLLPALRQFVYLRFKRKRKKNIQSVGKFPSLFSFLVLKITSGTANMSAQVGIEMKGCLRYNMQYL